MTNIKMALIAANLNARVTEPLGRPLYKFPLLLITRFNKQPKVQVAGQVTAEHAACTHPQSQFCIRAKEVGRLRAHEEDQPATHKTSHCLHTQSTVNTRPVNSQHTPGPANTSTP